MADKPLPRLVGVAGRMYSGKDTLGAHLVERYGYTRVAFADAVKDAAMAVNPIIFVLGDSTPMHLADLRLKDETAVDVCNRLKHDVPEVRRLLQAIGNEMGQGIFGKTFWIDLLLNSLDDVQKYVITDVRYPHEAAAIQARGGCVVRLSRPESVVASDHPSETQVAEIKPDFDVSNSSTPDVMFHQATRFLAWWEYQQQEAAHAQ